MTNFDLNVIGPDDPSKPSFIDMRIIVGGCKMRARGELKEMKLSTSVEAMERFGTAHGLTAADTIIPPTLIEFSGTLEAMQPTRLERAWWKVRYALGWAWPPWAIGRVQRWMDRRRLRREIEEESLIEESV